MAKKAWAAFPHPDKAFQYDGAKLAKAWPALHAGDQEPFPDEKRVASLLKANPKLGKDAGAIAAELQDAWRAFHRGDFQQAHDAGVALKALGASVAVKAGGIHATYLVDDAAAKTARYEELVRLADEAVAALPGRSELAITGRAFATRPSQPDDLDRQGARAGACRQGARFARRDARARAQARRGAHRARRLSRGDRRARSAACWPS